MNKKSKIILGMFFSVPIFLIIIPVYIGSVSEGSSDESGQTENLDEETLAGENKEEIKMVFVGDIMLSRYIGVLIEREENPTFPFLLMQDFLNEADVLFGNLESPISDNGYDLGGVYSFRADPKVISGLKKAGFDVLSFANNHVWDYGEEAFLDTLNRLEKAKILYVGAGRDFKEARTAKIVEVKGERIAFLAYTGLLPSFLFQKDSKPAVAYLSEELIEKDIEKIKNEDNTDLIVVSFHWGEEYQLIQNSFQEKVGRFAIDVGADLVIGHHPHTIQPVEEYNGGLIAYSLGNFVFDQNFDRLTSEGLALEVVFKDGGIIDFIPHKVEFNSKYQPYLSVPQTTRQTGLKEKTDD